MRGPRRPRERGRGKFSNKGKLRESSRYCTLHDNLDFREMTASAVWKTIFTEDQPQTRTKYLQKTHLTKGCYPDYTENPLNPQVRKLTTQLKMDQGLEQTPAKMSQWQKAPEEMSSGIYVAFPWAKSSLEKTRMFLTATSESVRTGRRGNEQTGKRPARQGLGCCSCRWADMLTGTSTERTSRSLKSPSRIAVTFFTPVLLLFFGQVFKGTKLHVG